MYPVYSPLTVMSHWSKFQRLQFFNRENFQWLIAWLMVYLRRSIIFFILFRIRCADGITDSLIGCMQCRSSKLQLDSSRSSHTHIHTHTHTRLAALCPGLPRWAGTRNVKPIWILLKQETVSGSGISWAICKSAPRSRQITMHASTPPLTFFTGRMPFLPPNQQRQSTEGSSWTLI